MPCCLGFRRGARGDAGKTQRSTQWLLHPSLPAGAACCAQRRFLRSCRWMRSHRWACVCHTSAWHGCVPVINTGCPSSASARGLAAVSHGPALPAPFCLSCRTCLTPCAKPGRRRRKRKVTWFPSRDGDMPPSSCARGVWCSSLSTQRVFLRDESSGSSQRTA